LIPRFLFLPRVHARGETTRGVHLIVLPSARRSSAASVCKTAPSSHPLRRASPLRPSLCSRSAGRRAATEPPRCSTPSSTREISAAPRRSHAPAAAPSAASWPSRVVARSTTRSASLRSRSTPASPYRRPAALHVRRGTPAATSGAPRWMLLQSAGDSATTRRRLC
jgi:hypothetical protein